MPDSSAAEQARLDPDTAEPAIRPAPAPASLARFLALDDFEPVARRRLPRMIYGYVAGAVETGAAYANALAGYGDYALIPRTLQDVSRRRQDCELFGQRYAAPFGVPPLGGSAMVAYRGDLALADAAQAMGVPMILSAASLMPADATRARETGCDGIIVSSHGGRQLDHAIAPIRVLPEMVAAAGPMTVMIDGGIRRGTDVLKALALGAKFVFVGRPFLYAAHVGGAPAVLHAMRLLSSEIHRDMALMGLRSLAELGPDAVRRAA